MSLYRGMVRKIVMLMLFLFFFVRLSPSQELFPLNEPASNVPKGVLGIRAFGETFQEINVWRRMGALRLMYGLTPRLSVYITGTISNHHNKMLPKDLVTHTHIGNQTYFYTNNVKRGVSYPYLFNGVNIYAKYRFLEIDGQNRHFRIASYGEYSYIKSAHDEAEPNLLDDTRGYGGGLLTTWLVNKFAVSATTGVIFPGSYSEVQQDPRYTISHKDSTQITYGKAVKYNLSFGYLVYPRRYKNYKQANWNVYLEFIGKSYQQAKIVQNGISIPPKSMALKAGHYVELYLGIQKIIDSNFRVDLTVGFPIVNQSYIHFYPVYMVGVQKYFYPKINKKLS